MKVVKKLEKYYSKHVWYAKVVHIITGVGLGILITYPLAGEHPVRWGLAILAIGLLGSLIPLMEG